MALRHYRLRHTVVVINSITAVIRPCIKLTATLPGTHCVLTLSRTRQSKLKLQAYSTTPLYPLTAAAI